MARPSGRPARLLAELGSSRLLSHLRLPASYVPVHSDGAPRSSQPCVCVPDLQLRPRRRVMLHNLEAHRSNIIVAFFFFVASTAIMFTQSRFGSLDGA